MKLISDDELERSAIVANCTMNRERNLYGTNGYERDLRFDPLAFLRTVSYEKGSTKWLDLCCGTAKALVEAAERLDRETCPVSIVGVDLVGMFFPSTSTRLTVIEASLSHWEPTEAFDLITCVHGLHYIGNKLGLIDRACSWLTPEGKFVAHLDKNNLLLEEGTCDSILQTLRRVGLVYSARYKLLQRIGCLRVRLPYRYLGADDRAGPNYTGQPAVNSHYQFVTQQCPG